MEYFLYMVGLLLCADSAWPGGGYGGNRGSSGTVGDWYCRRGDADWCHSGVSAMLPERDIEKGMEISTGVGKLALGVGDGGIYCIGGISFVGGACACCSGGNSGSGWNLLVVDNMPVPG